jgi:hypothetical protein
VRKERNVGVPFVDYVGVSLGREKTTSPAILNCGYFKPYNVVNKIYFIYCQEQAERT